MKEENDTGWWPAGPEDQQVKIKAIRACFV
jgi:hypothetical protein